MKKILPIAVIAFCAIMQPKPSEAGVVVSIGGTLLPSLLLPAVLLSLLLPPLLRWLLWLSVLSPILGLGPCAPRASTLA
jgi:hypothetical protein